MRALAAALLALACAAPAARDVSHTEGAPGAAKFRPRQGTLLVVGQDLGSIAGYTQHVWPSPGGVTGYVRIDPDSARVPGLRSVQNDGAGDNDASELAARYPHSVLVLGLYLVDHGGQHLRRLADGELDAGVDDLAAFIRDARRPVLLRIGYEFDGPWNRYEPEPYKAAFRHVVERLRERGADNVASVWQSATSAHGTYRNLPLDAWYPGDDVVDWCGSSYFDFSAPHHEALLAFARARHKPVMIAEAAPRGYDLEALTFSDDGRELVPKTPEAIWSEWFAPFFAFVHAHRDAIGAVAYIDCDWASQPMWSSSGGNGYWGDTRVEANAQIRARWREEIQNGRWLHGSSQLFADLGLR